MLFKNRLLIVLFLLSCAACTKKQSHVEPSLNPAEGNADYGWAIQTLDGKGFKLSQVKDKVVFINIWATWCGPCVQEMPSLQKLYSELNKEVFFIFASDEDKSDVAEFLRVNNYTIPVYLYSESDLPSVFSSYGIPMTFIVSPAGKIVVKEYGGPVNWNTEKTVSFLRSLSTH